MLTVPQLLQELVDAGRWPKDDESFQARQQFGGPVALYNPPFLTVRVHSTLNRFWMRPEADPSGIDFDLALVIGDHGVGDDSPILLDYRGDISNPKVLYLHWGSPNRWAVVADDFRTFAEKLGLLNEPPPPSSFLSHPPNCVYCKDTGQCYCIRKGSGSPAKCARCNGSGACHVCRGRKQVS